MAKFLLHSTKINPKFCLNKQGYLGSIAYIAKLWKHTEFPLVRNWLIKLWYMHMMEYYTIL